MFLATDSWNISKSGDFSFFFSFLNRLKLEMSILSWQRNQPLGSNPEFCVRNSLKV